MGIFTRFDWGPAVWQWRIQKEAWRAQRRAWRAQHRLARAQWRAQWRAAHPRSIFGMIWGFAWTLFWVGFALFLVFGGPEARHMVWQLVQNVVAWFKDLFYWLLSATGSVQ